MHEKAGIRQEGAVLEHPLEIVPGVLWLINGEAPHRNDASGYAIKTDCGTILLDPGSGANTDRVTANLREIHADSANTIIIGTHGHMDHVGGSSALIQTGYASELWLPEECITVEPTGDVTAADLYGSTFPPIRVDRRLADGEILDFGNVVLQVVATPGHSPDHAGFIMRMKDNPDMIIAVCGDIYGGHSPRLGGDLNVRVMSIGKFGDNHFTHFVEGHGSIQKPLRQRAEFDTNMSGFGDQMNPGFKYLFDPVQR